MITNKTTGEKISKTELNCKSIFSQTRGLMFRKKHNLIMHFHSKRKISLHMFFVFYPIDIFILDSEKKVVEIKRNFKPFTIWYPKNNGNYLIEMVELNKKVKIGDSLDFK